MQKGETTDCVEMKNMVQADRLVEYQGLTDEQVRVRLAQTLATSDDVVARKWRRIGKPGRQPSQKHRVA